MSGSIIKLPTLKQIIAGLLATLMMFSSMITGKKFGKVEVSLVGDVTTESEEITLEIKNYSFKSVGYGEDFTLEVKNGENWKKVPATGGFHDYWATLRGLSGTEVSVKLRDSFGKTLEAGKYRLTKEVGGKEYSIIFVVSNLSGTEDILELFNLSANRIKTQAVKVTKNFEDLRHNEEYTEIPNEINAVGKILIEKFLEKDETPVDYKGNEIVDDYPVSGEKYVSRATVEDLDFASCEIDEKYYYITLGFKECTDPVESGCANAFNLVNSEDYASAGMVKEFSVKYYDATIECKIEKSTGNMVWAKYTLPMVWSLTAEAVKEFEIKIGATFVDDYTITY